MHFDPQRRRTVGRVLILVVLTLGCQGTRGIWSADESYDTVIARTMLETGDWLVPHVVDQVWLDRPPLSHWGIAAGMWLLGVNEWGARLSHALWFVLSTVLVFVLGCSFWDERSGRLAAIFYATMLLPFVAANIGAPDTPLTLWTTAVLVAFWLARDRSNPHAEWWKVSLGLVLALGVWTKGPAALIPGGAIVVLLVTTGGLRDDDAHRQESVREATGSRAMIGRTLGHYRIVDRLGAGGMGEVYRAEDARLGRQVALKVLPTGVAADPSRLSRLHREARALAALDHTGIVTVYSVEETDGVHFITMELVEGRTLAEVIPAHGMPVGELLAVASSLADALAAAHAKGVAHRDLKPGNVMLARDGRVKVLDFGLARWLDPTAPTMAAELSTEALTYEGALMGTAPYMSPEQIEGRPADARSDIFALGTIMYEMATGRRPFRGDSGAAVISAILRDEPPPPVELRPDLPDEFARLVRRCLAKDPDRRFQTALDLRNELDEIARESAASASGRASAPMRAPRRIHALAAAALAAAMLVAVATALIATRRGRPADATTAAGEIRSIAVLPFVNLMHDPAQDYFVEGMQETLITTLAKLHPLRVTSRTSAMRFKGSATSIPEIARALGVDAVIEGSVLRAGNRVRITAQLIRGASDEHVWAESYDRDVSDVLGLLSEVAGAIAAEVRIALTPEQQDLLAAARPVPPEAQEAYLLGRQATNEFTNEGRRRAVLLFQRALALDPGFASAWASLAGVELTQALFDDVPAAEVRAAAECDARRAIALDPADGHAHGTIGLLRLYFDWDWPAAEENLRRAVQLDPTDAGIRHGYADLLLVQGRLEESVDQVQVGQRYDPLNPLANAVLVGHLIFARHYERALAELDRIEAAIPNTQGPTSSFRFITLWQLGRKDEALEVLRRRWAVRAGDMVAALDAGLTRGGPVGAVAGVARFLGGRVGAGGVSPLSAASYFALAGDADHALPLLEQALDAREPFLLHLKADPYFHGIRADPRFAELVRRIGFPD